MVGNMKGKSTYQIHQLLSKIKLTVNEHVYTKDPQSSDLGRRIISGSIDLINELGFDNFTFRKLAQHINSTEASVYRYFDSKYKLLLYLTGWYWAWLEYKMAFKLHNIPSPMDRLERAINLLTEPPKSDINYDYINTEKLSQIVISESAKTYLTKDVDEENSYGVFLDYKNLVGRVADIVLEINPDYKYPKMLISTVIEGVHQQRFFGEHLPRLTDLYENEDSPALFFKQMVFELIAN